MKGVAITIDAAFSILIFITLLYFLGSIWNYLVQEFDRQQEDLLKFRTEQSLTLIFNQVRKSGHKLSKNKIEDFVNQANSNYTETKNNLGMGEFEFKFLAKDLENTILYQTNNSPTESTSMIITSTRYGYTNKPIELELWVWT